jgi:hypothetical protein
MEHYTNSMHCVPNWFAATHVPLLNLVLHVTVTAGEAGLRLSLLERLAGSLPYSAAEQHPTAAAGLIVKLLRNYR